MVFLRSGLWSFSVFGGFAFPSVWFGRMLPGLHEVIQYTHTLSEQISGGGHYMRIQPKRCCFELPRTP